jgi:ubiquinone/menaquinone biosynthesis C-methylase UbiE
VGDKDIDRLSLFDALAGGYDTWFETRIGAFVHRRQLAMLGRLVGPRAGERLLEVGSGTGHFLREFARSGARCVGIEPSEEMLSVARASPMEGVQYLRGEGEHMPLADGIFDCVAYITTLEWVADVEACVSEAVRICVPGGRLVFLVLNARGPWYRQRVGGGTLLRRGNAAATAVSVRHGYGRICSARAAVVGEVTAGGDWRGRCCFQTTRP